jgi:uncharacterized protein
VTRVNVMRLKQILSILRQMKPTLHERYGVERIGVFGSVARGEDGTESDVDLLVDFSRPIGWEIVDLQDELERALGNRVDLVTRRALRPAMRDDVLRELEIA